MQVHFYAELVNFFARSLNDRDAARDVVQESYARVLRLQARSAVVNDLRALLFRTGKNIVIDEARRRKAEAAVLETLSLVHQDDAPSAQQAVEARQQLDRLLARLNVMPRKRREAFILVRIYGFTHAEAAVHLETTPVSIEKHIVRAICTLLAQGA